MWTIPSSRQTIPKTSSDSNEDIMKRFKITVNDKVDKHLGVNIARREDGSIKLTQPRLLKMILDEFEEDARRSQRRLSVPMKPIPKSGDDSPFDRTTYLHLLGMLYYLLRSRPGISTALSFAATKAVSPTISDWMWHFTFPTPTTSASSCILATRTNLSTSDATLTPPS